MCVYHVTYCNMYLRLNRHIRTQSIINQSCACKQAPTLTDHTQTTACVGF